MDTPSIPHLQRISQFEVGDDVYLHGFTIWRVSARYWSPREQCIVYDLLFVRNGVESLRVREDRLSAVAPRPAPPGAPPA